MSRKPVLGIQPEVIQWARTSIGLPIIDVAQKLAITIEEIEAWELGLSAPSYSQLEKLAYSIYKRPLAVFFLPAPPDEVMPVHEFRTLPQTDLENLAADTHFQIRKAHVFQISLKELFDNQNPSTDCIWRKIKLSLNRSITEQAETIRAYLNISLIEQAKWKNAESALKKWRQAIESSGAFIFKAPFKQKEISGFCLIDDQFPVIYLNNSTAKTRQIFSLLHEFAHLLLSQNSITKYNLNYIESLPTAEKRIEQFCNAIAAEILIPSADFEKQISSILVNIEKLSDEDFADLASRYGVSREVVLRRFLDIKRVSKVYYELKAEEWAQQKKEKGSGGNWYSSQNAYLSDHFAKEVLTRYHRNVFSLEQAADFLGVKAKNFEGLEKAILKGVAS